MSEPASIRVYGRPGSAAGYAIRDFLNRAGLPFEWIDISNHAATAREPNLGDVTDDRLPICVLPDGSRLERPTVRQVLEKLGWYRMPSRSEYDLAIYGAGPAGLSAAVYAASEGLKTVLVERWTVGGQAASSPRIENYLGFPEGISGGELADRARQQATRFGAEILLQRDAVRGEFSPGKGTGYLADGTKIVARASVCATGVDYRRLDLPNETRFYGAGIYYGAGASEASLCENAHVVVVGGGNSAGQAALHFARRSSVVTMVLLEASLREHLSEYLIDRIEATPRIHVLLRTKVVGLSGDLVLRAITIRNLDSGEEHTIETSWVFVCIGGVPRTDWAEEVGIVRDQAGYLVTGPDLMRGGGVPPRWTLNRHPYYLETNIPGVFAAGDVRHGSIKRFASAVGEGAMAVSFVQRYLGDR